MTVTLPKVIADFTTTIVNSVAVGDTTATLTSVVDQDGVTAPTGMYGLTIDRKNSQKEYYQCTLTGTSLTNIKTVTRGTAVATAGFARAHRKGAEVIISDWFVLKRIVDLLDGTTGFDSATPIKYDAHPTFSADTQIVDKKYIDDIVIAGAPDASSTIKGISKLSEDPVSPTDPIAVGDTDTRVPTQDENDALVGYSGSQPNTANPFLDKASLSDGNPVDQSQTTQDGIVAVGEADATTKYNFIAQSFVAGKSPIKSVNLYKSANTGTFTGTVTVSIQNDVSGSPSGTALATVTINNATYLALGTGEFLATFAAEYIPTIGSTYWIVIQTSTSDNSNHPNLGTNTAGGYASGSVKFKNVTDGWASIATIDLYFKVNANTADKVLTTSSTGELPIGLVNQMSQSAFFAEEVIAIRDAVLSYYYHPEPILYDSKNIVAGATTTSGGTVSVPLTVGNNANRVLVAFVTYEVAFGGGAITLTWAGDALTQVDSVILNSNQQRAYSYTLFAPTVGVNTLQVNFPNSGQAYTYSISVYSYYKVSQSGIETSAIGDGGLFGAQNVSNSVTTVTPGALAVSALSNWEPSGNLPSGSVAINDNTQSMSTKPNMYTGDTGAILMPGTVFTTSGTDNTNVAATIVLAPATPAISGYLSKTSASSVASPLLNKYTTFAGFAGNAANQGEIVSLIHSGVVSGFSGLIVGRTYYLSNTGGAISITAGSNSRKVGVAITTTDLLITNNW